MLVVGLGEREGGKGERKGLEGERKVIRGKGDGGGLGKEMYIDQEG